MVIVKSVQGLCSDDFSGKIGVSCGFGLALLGDTQFGDDNDRAGIYAHKYTKKGKAISRMKSYVCRNLQKTNQQTWRGVFANGVIAWHALDTESKRAYNVLKYPTALSGFNRFMRKYLKENQ